MAKTEKWYIRLRTLLFRQHTGTGRLALAVGTGIFIGLTPLYGFHALLGFAAAWLLRLNIAVTVLATQIANPFFAPALIYASAWIGSYMGGGEPPSNWYDPTAREFYMAWLRGGPVLGLVLGACSASITFGLLTFARSRRHG